MNPFTAFLRGVMPSGRSTVKMADVRQVLSANGFADARTWIQRGNIALRSPLDAPPTAARIHELLHLHLDIGLAVVVKTRSGLQAVLDGNPFATESHDIRRVFLRCAIYRLPPLPV